MIDFIFFLPVLWPHGKKLLEKFFPPLRAARITKEIYDIMQIAGETLHEYWECIKRLCASYPNHQIFDLLLIHYFYEALDPSYRSTIDATSGGSLVSETPTKAKQLISTCQRTPDISGLKLRNAKSTQEVSELKLNLLN